MRRSLSPIVVDVTQKYRLVGRVCPLDRGLAGSVSAVTTFINGAKTLGYDLVSIERCLWGPNFQRHPSWVRAASLQFCCSVYKICYRPHGSNGCVHHRIYVFASIRLLLHTCTHTCTPAHTHTHNHTHPHTLPWQVYAHRRCASPVPAWPSGGGCPMSDWSLWSPCDTPCGTGTSTRVRYAMPPALQTTVLCTGTVFVEAQSCSAGTACSPESVCGMGPWTNWGACTARCGGGTRVRTRPGAVVSGTCGPLVQTQVCNAQSC